MAAARDLTASATRRPRILLACWGVLCLEAGATLLATAPPEPGALGTLPAPVVAVPSRGVLLGPPAVPFRPPWSAPGAVDAGVVPVGIAFPGRDVRAPVVPVRTDGAGALVVPDAPSTVGWWSPSALAGGATGPTVLAGHVDTAAAGIGALAVLRVVEVGERIEVTGVDGRTFAYEVVARRQYVKAELPPEVFAAGAPPGLVLITCGGRFDPRTRHYEDNVVVFAAKA